MTSQEAKQRMESGRLYLPTDEEIVHKHFLCLEKLYDYNATRPSQSELRGKMLKDMFAKIGERCYIEPPFYAEFAGANVYFGDDVYANFNLTLIDDSKIFVGDNVMFGPNVTIATAGHPIEPNLRRAQLQFNIDVHIGNNVWIGAGAIILPGITIGDNCVIGAGSVVTKDIPQGVVAVGNPCKILREINEHDEKFYFKDRKIDIELSEI